MHSDWLDVHAYVRTNNVVEMNSVSVFLEGKD